MTKPRVSRDKEAYLLQAIFFFLPQASYWEPNLISMCKFLFFPPLKLTCLYDFPQTRLIFATRWRLSNPSQNSTLAIAFKRNSTRFWGFPACVRSAFSPCCLLAFFLYHHHLGGSSSIPTQCQVGWLESCWRASSEGFSAHMFVVCADR